MHKLATEFIGTFFLVFVIGLTVLQGSPMAPLAIGSALMVMVYMGGHISGAHYNPAVSLAILMRGAMDAKDLLPYWVAQILGAVCASFAVESIFDRCFVPAPAADASGMAALLVEVVFTMALALVVLNTATAKETEGNSYFGLAIGFTVMVGAFAGGGISGGAFNPAVGLGPILVNGMVGTGSMANVGLYLAGPFAGAALAAVIFKAQHPEE